VGWPFGGIVQDIVGGIVVGSVGTSIEWHLGQQERIDPSIGENTRDMDQ
jgi:hypothetical protein